MDNTEVTKEREQPIIDPKVEGLKVKNKPKKLTSRSNKVAKVDLSQTKKEENAISGETTKSVQDEGSTRSKSGENTKVEVPHENKNKEEKEIVVIQEITDNKTETVIENDIAEELKNTPNSQLPENVDKLVKFMQDTGGNMEDYIRLNTDYTKADDLTLLKEYYKKTKPHLDKGEIEFMLDDKFAYNSTVDSEKEVRKRKLAIKEEVANAHGYLEKLKSEYYDEIKLKSNTTPDQQKAMDFFNKHNKEQQTAQKRREDFVKRTTNHFSQEFKGFDFELGEKKFRYQINNTSDVASKQSNIENFVKKFLDENGDIKDMTGYHKALYTASNADSLANHFYEQGKADAIRSEYKKSKNINDDTRVVRSDNDIRFNGMKISAVNGVDSSKLKIKRKT